MAFNTGIIPVWLNKKYPIRSSTDVTANAIIIAANFENKHIKRLLCSKHVKNERTLLITENNESRRAVINVFVKFNIPFKAPFNLSFILAEVN